MNKKNDSFKFLKERAEKMLFPFPAEGESVDVSPPGFSWLPVIGASNYHLVILTSERKVIYEKDVGADPVHLPDLILPPDDYYWNILAKDSKGNNYAWRGENKFSITRQATHFPWISPSVLLGRVSEEHPKFLYTKNAVLGIREKIESTKKKSWTYFIKHVEKSVGKIKFPEYPSYQYIQNYDERKIEYRKYHKDLASILDEGLINTSLAFLITGETKYASVAKKILLEVSSWPTNLDDATSVCSIFGDEPGLLLAKSMHRAYDWLFHFLNNEERKLILKACEGRAWQTYHRLVHNQNYLTYPGESHEGRLIVYLSEMAIVMNGECKRMEVLLEYSLKALTTIYPYWGGNDGGWVEGINYGANYNALYLPTFEALRITCNYNLWNLPFYKNLRWFFFYCKSLRSEISPFGDGAEQDDMVFKNNLINLMTYHGRLYNDPYCNWWAKEFNDQVSLSGVVSLMIDDDFKNKSPKDLPNSRVFYDVGWVAMHSNISEPDHDTFLLFKSSPYGSVSHSHADQNAFTIMKGGDALAISSGYYGPAYGAPHHSRWTRTTKANNCILINGSGQIVRSQDSKGKICDFEDKKNFSYTVGDAKLAYKEELIKYKRYILFLRPGLFLMLDDIVAKHDSSFQWMLHTLERMNITGQHIVSQRGDAKLDVYLSCPLGFDINQTDQFEYPYNDGVSQYQHREVQNHWHLTASTKSKSKFTRIGAIMCASDLSGSVEIKLLNHYGWFGASVTGSFGKVLGWIQIVDDAPGPDGLGDDVLNGKVKICGVDKDGIIYTK